jgi:hypothetical protein
MAISPKEVKKLMKGRTRQDFIKNVEKATGKKFKDISRIKMTVKEPSIGYADRN